MTFSIQGLQSPAEVDAAWRAVRQFRQSAGGGEPPAKVQSSIDPVTAALADRIHKGLTFGPLGPRYRDMLEAWFEAPVDALVGVEELAQKVRASAEETRASLSKLSGRMRRIATPDEESALRTPFLLLADIQYNEKNSASHRLTAAGREAVRRYLKR